MRLPILILHKSAAIVGLLSGTLAMSLGKGSFGQQQGFPVLRKQYILSPLAILPLVLLPYWLVGVEFTERGNALFNSTFEGKIGAAQTSEA